MRPGVLAVAAVATIAIVPCSGQFPATPTGTRINIPGTLELVDKPPSATPVEFLIATIQPPNGGYRFDAQGPVRPENVVVADYLDDTGWLFREHEVAGGDFVFAAAPFPGLPWVEASLGCGVEADHTSGSTRSTPPPGFALNPVVPQFSADNPWVTKMLEFVPALEAQSAGRYPVGVTLMRGIADLLSALYGPENFVLRMYDDPEEVHSVVGHLTEYWIAFGRCLLDQLPLFHGGTNSFFYGLWCPGKMIWLQEDAVALLSPALYEKFIYPADCRIAGSFENAVMHLHPTRFIPSRQLVATNLAAIELHSTTMARARRRWSRTTGRSWKQNHCSSAAT